MQQNKPYICFYSNKCNISKAFLSELKGTPWITSFNFVCVDPSPSRPKLPAWLKVVPTLVVSGETNPREGNETMNWLSEMKIRNASSSAPSVKAGTLDAVGGMTGDGNVEAWNTSEHVSFSKGLSYSFNDSDTSAEGSGGYSIPGAFAFLNGASSPSQGPPSIADVKQKSKKEQMFDTQMEEYKRARDAGMPPAAGRI